MTGRCENGSAGLTVRRRAPLRGGASRLASLIFTVLLDVGYIAATVPALTVALLRGKGANALDHLRRRLLAGMPPRNGSGPCLWLHGVSVGEVLAARSLVGDVASDFPGWDVVVSSSTRAGVESARLHFREHMVISSPLDLSWLVRRAFRRIRPAVIVIVEHDLWPNWLRQARNRGVPVALVNARLSRRSRRGYGRLSFFYPWLERHVALVCAQDEASADGYRRLGFAADKVRVTGNLKFDSPAPSVTGVREELGFDGEDWVLVAGSTHAGEEEAVLDAFARLRERAPRTYLVLAPRRTERTEQIAALIGARGFGFSRRSQATKPPADVLLVDTVGELARISGAADVVFVGGSLVPVGGHNVIEPASLGKPVLLGPHYHNQKSVMDSFLEQGAVIVVGNGAELAEKILELKENPRQARELGERARITVTANLGAGERTREAIKELLL